MLKKTEHGEYNNVFLIDPQKARIDFPYSRTFFLDQAIENPLFTAYVGGQTHAEAIFRNYVEQYKEATNNQIAVSFTTPFCKDHPLGSCLKLGEVSFDEEFTRKNYFSLYADIPDSHDYCIGWRKKLEQRKQFLQRFLGR